MQEAPPVYGLTFVDYDARRPDISVACQIRPQSRVFEVQSYIVVPTLASMDVIVGILAHAVVRSSRENSQKQA